MIKKMYKIIKRAPVYIKDHDGSFKQIDTVNAGETYYSSIQVEKNVYYLNIGGGPNEFIPIIDLKTSTILVTNSNKTEYD
jgi:hypothetical protein